MHISPTTPVTSGHSRPERPHTRDHRIDALRGAALLMMFVDHIPENLLNRLTIRNLGFADAAEIFVLLAGYSSWLAYGRGFEKRGVPETLKRLIKRCFQIYIAQAVMIAVSLLTIKTWRHHWPVPVDFLEPELAHGTAALWRIVVMDALPSNLNILPLYLVLLAIFPLICVFMRVNRVLALAVSGAIWLFTNLDPDLNFPNWLDPDGWYFDPFAWQFLFTIGACGAVEAAKHHGNFPAFRGAQIMALLYLMFSFMQAFPWAQWGLPDYRVLVMPSPDKSILSPLRLLDVLAIFYLVQSSSRTRRWSETRFGQILAVIGRHSLEVFTVGTIIDLYARLIFSTFGNNWMLQILINAIGIPALYVLARCLDTYRRKQKAA